MFTLVLQYCIKLLHTWMVFTLSYTVPGLVAIFSCYFSLSFYLYLFRGGEVVCCVESRLCSTIVLLRCILWSTFIEFWMFWCCFDVCIFASLLICIIFFLLFVPSLGLVLFLVYIWYMVDYSLLVFVSNSFYLHLVSSSFSFALFC